MIILALAALLSGFAFGGSLVVSLAVCVTALLFVGGRLYLRKKGSPILRASFGVAGLAILLSVSLVSGLASGRSGFLSYEQSLDTIGRLIERGEYGQAGGFIEELQTRYGRSDAILLLQAQAAIGREDLGDAAAALAQVVNKHEKTYYILQGEVYRQRDNYTQLQSLYIEAASLYPLWSEAQRLAGAQAAVNRNYVVAEYFLLRAFEQMPTDPVPLYYLGVICLEQNNPVRAEQYFAEAMEHSPDDTIAGYIAWYRSQMDGDAQ